MWQVRDGYHKEYPLWGTQARPFGVHQAWIAMVVVLATVYVAGLALLPKQYKLESERAQNEPGGEEGIPKAN
jgi:hypothetical protein